LRAQKALRRTKDYRGRTSIPPTIDIHCYLVNDKAGQKGTETFASLYPDKVVNESSRYIPIMT